MEAITNQEIVELEANKFALEDEKEKFIITMCNMIDSFNLERIQLIGRPRTNLKDILKSLLIISYNCKSYRRSRYELKQMFEAGLISSIPSRSTLSDYSNDQSLIHLLEELIQFSSLFFIENEDTAILDSTWFGFRMYTGGYTKVHKKDYSSLSSARKLHVVCLKNSKVIAYAKATKGTVNDNPLFEQMVRRVIENGFIIKTILADAGYSSKLNYALCKELGIMSAYIDFRSNACMRRSKSDLWREKLKLYKENHEIWHETYRFRVIIEGVFSAIKRKNITYLRSKKDTSQDIELLLKALVYNFTIIAKYS